MREILQRVTSHTKEEEEEKTAAGAKVKDEQRAKVIQERVI